MNTPSLRFKEFSGEWKEISLSEIAKLSKGKGVSKASVVENGAFKCVRYGELYTKYKEKITEVNNFTSDDKLIFSERNDILIPSSGETAVDLATASCIYTDDKIAIGGDINIIKTKENGLFLSYSLNNKYRNEIAKLSQGISVIHLYNSHLKELKIKTPSLEEQNKIAMFLSLVDKRIELQEDKIGKLERYKKGMMQKVFSQGIRFKDYAGIEYPEWENGKLKKFIIQCSIKNKENKNYQILSVTNKEGFILQSDYFDKRVASTNLNNYKIINRNNFAYNPSRINVGSIALLKEYDNGVLSPMYTVFKTNLDPDFLNYFTNTHSFKEGIKRYLIGSVRQSLSFKDLGLLQISVPIISEQKRISKFLSIIDFKIEKERELFSNLTQLKIGLLQQMFV
jgi:type I restriction enzyme S subunit